jgi:CHAT domain-containing protein
VTIVTARRWWIGAGACAIAAAAVVTRAVWLERTDADLSALAAAVGTSLPFEARLTGGFRPPARPMSGLPDAHLELPPDARIAVARIEKRALVDTRSSTRAVLGVAYLIDGDVDRAIAALEEVTALDGPASAWSDLSAAYLVKAGRQPTHRIEFVARALDAASHAIQLRPIAEASFNRALAMEALAPYVDVPRPWDEYVRARPADAWTEVARRHQSSPPDGAEARASWDERRKTFAGRLDAGDRPFVIDSVHRFPEATLEVFDEMFGDAVAAASKDERDARFARAADLAAMWSETTRDAMPRDAVRQARETAARPDRSRELARAHIAYRDAVAAYRADRYEPALASAVAAQESFRRADSPYWAWAALQTATVLFQLRRLDESAVELARVETFAREHGYTTLLWRTLRQRGLTQSKAWRLDEALQVLREAEQVFRSTGEREDAVAVSSLIADDLRMLGEHHEGWAYIGRTLESVASLRTPLRRYLVFYNASLFSSSQDLLESALVFQDAAVREAKVRGGGPVAEALSERAALHRRRHDEPSAARDLREARAVIDAMPEGVLKRWHTSDIDVLLADFSAGGSAHAEKVERAIAFFSTAEPSRLPRLYLSLARVFHRVGSDERAERALADGIARLERQHDGLDDEALKISYFDESWQLFPEMVALQTTVRHDVAASFEYAERSRGRSLTAGTRPIRLTELEQRMPASVALLYYVTLPDRLLTWVVTAGKSTLIEQRVPREDLLRDVTRQVASFQDARQADQRRDTRLYDVLIRPATASLEGRRTLAIVADGDLQRLPFAAVRNPATGRALVEDYAFVTAPSATVFAMALDRLRARTGGQFESALLIGNPETSGAASELTSLPASQREAVTAASRYAHNEVLTGVDATRARFLEDAPRFDVVHFGGHALVNTEYPLLSRIAFAADSHGVPESLFAYEISRMPLSRTMLVVLAACSTATGAVSRGEGVVSIARPFLGAGVPVVIASAWDVDDATTAQLFTAFHEELTRSGDPVQALRSAQLSLLHSGDAALASPRAWGGFVALGATAQ